MARYNNSEEQLERLCGSLNWFYGATCGREFCSIQSIVDFFVENISVQADKTQIANRSRTIISEYPGLFWLVD
ncbi:protein of unknown function [Shewanella benthica]|uniref:Uncharacterized protein n=1 Tax=Shewanella benthica TaxID=43661 RepID=A0A330LYX0_9GAMM|nr:protein of unknown function [Shewanella benthica]